MTGKSSPMTLRGTEIKGPKLKMAETEHPVLYSDNSPAKKMKVKCTKSPAVDATSSFETEWADAVRDMNLLFSQYSEVLKERAAMDAAQADELESILSEALVLESKLKEKKEHLRRSLAIISDKLQG